MKQTSHLLHKDCFNASKQANISALSSVSRVANVAMLRGCTDNIEELQCRVYLPRATASLSSAVTRIL
jgi:hypothetical protein